MTCDTKIFILWYPCCFCAYTVCHVHLIPPTFSAIFVVTTLLKSPLFSFIIRCFPLQNVAISAVFVLSLFAGGTANAAYSADNGDFYDDFCDGRTLRDEAEEGCDNVETVRNAEGATAVSFNVMYIAMYASCDHSYLPMYIAMIT